MSFWCNFLFIAAVNLILNLVYGPHFWSILTVFRKIDLLTFQKSKSRLFKSYNCTNMNIVAHPVNFSALEGSLQRVWPNQKYLFRLEVMPLSVRSLHSSHYDTFCLAVGPDLLHGNYAVLPDNFKLYSKIFRIFTEKKINISV